MYKKKLVNLFLSKNRNQKRPLPYFNRFFFSLVSILFLIFKKKL